MERYLPTGNEQISIPRLNEVTAAIEDITFLWPAGACWICAAAKHSP